jgi:hypothetical protein
VISLYLVEGIELAKDRPAATRIAAEVVAGVTGRLDSLTRHATAGI